MKTIYLSGEVGWEITLSKLRNQMNPSSKEKVRIIINSYGGSVPEAFEIYNFLGAYKGKIEIVIGAMAASAASYIAMVVPVANRKGFKNSSFMTHEAKSGVYGRARDFEIHAKRLEGINNIVAEAYSTGLGIEIDSARSMMTEDNYITGGEDLLKNNVISGIIDIEDVDIPDKENDEDGFMFFDFLSESIKNKINRDVATSKMYDAEDKILKDFKKNKESFEKIAAHLENFEPKKTVEDNKLTTEGEMDLKSFLKATPEANAEYEKDLQSAEAKGKKDVMIEGSTALVDSERKRISSILSAAGIEVTETVATALDDGSDVGTFATAELARQNKSRTETPAPVFGELANRQTPGEQGNEPEPQTAEQIEASAKKAAEKLASDTGGI